MRKVVLGLVVAVALVAATAVLRAGAQDFTVINKTGFTINALFVSPSDKDDWEDDILGKDVLENGDSTDIEFSGYGDKVCKFDIRIDDTKENQYVIENVNLCEIHKMTFKKEGGKIVAASE